MAEASINDKSDSSSFEDLSIPNENEVLETGNTAKTKTDLNTPVNTEENEEVNTEENKEDKKDDVGVLDILGNGQLVKTVIKKGIPDTRPQRHDLCTVTYEGSLSNGLVVDKAEKAIVQLGDNEVIQGLDLALALMDTEEECELYVASRFAFGDIGNGSVIPPNSNLTYKITLWEARVENDLETKTISSRKIIGNKKRERGNWWYSRNEHTLAIHSYRRALEYLDDVEGGIIDPGPDGEYKVTDSDLQQLLEDRVKVYNNMAAAQMKIEAWDQALKSLENVLGCQPNNVKALFRKGSVLISKGNTQAALTVLKKAQVLDPNNVTIQQELQRLQKKSKNEAKHEQNLYKKMLGQPITIKESSQAKASGKSAGNKLKTYFCVAGSVAVGIIGVLAYRYKYM
ncbi:peptidyl-prolyl cis-trans isomerase FKBP8-like [Ctenocephalides felis]|uniref:peptidyl-prolyl cis-trans isomerase FKBP8-like n=1 Tax=Ctenocephalides felis TaxID=7515 RepID=UPI000E6E3586|nr:peptidyl-prolyl cis-trans isomerase FKBP8-like [Ctenocephalides felis]XP_026463373.1 peptidyl-prolyl cis-trans isomerase FKBP8-like [Ctenocephalides felis]